MSVALTQTTLAGALAINSNVVNVASATGIVGPTNQLTQKLYIINPETQRGELVDVAGVSGVAVTLGRLGGFRQAFVSGAIVLIGSQVQYLPSFQEFDPVGAVTSQQVQVTPWVNVVNGNQWLRSVDGLWVPGWGNQSQTPGVTAAVASAAGVILPSGPLFHVTGGLAVTGFTIPVGFTGGSFTIIPDGTFTWTTAGNIALAGTAVIGRNLTFTWDSNAAKFNPSYV